MQDCMEQVPVDDLRRPGGDALVREDPPTGRAHDAADGQERVDEQVSVEVLLDIGG